MHRTLLPLAACLVVASLAITSSGAVPSAPLPGPALADPTPAGALAKGFRWDYASWERNQDGDRVDDLIEAVEEQGLAALPRMADGFLPFLARETPDGVRLDVHVAFDRIITDADVAAIQAAGAQAVQLGTMLPSAWAVGITPAQARQVAALDGVAMVELEQQLRALNDVSRGATQVEDSATYALGVWDDLGYGGDEVGIAILDTGVDDNHASLQGSFVAGADATSTCGVTPVDVNPDDDNQVSVGLIGVGVSTFHGTHTAGSALGRGIGATGAYAGMAKEADLFDVKVLLGAGLSCLNSVVAGLSWVTLFNAGFTLWNNPSFPGNVVGQGKQVDVVSMSLGGSCSDGSDGLSQSVNWVVDQGLTVVVATGNNGVQNPTAKAGCITSPSAAVKAISVGAYHHQNSVTRVGDTVATFSNCGPSKYPPTSDQKKPDVTAPGVSIFSPWGDARPNGQVGSTAIHALSGTSMSTPIVAGIVALMIEKNASGSETPADLKALLRDNAAYVAAGPGFNIGADYESCWGFGQVHAYDSVAATPV